jgi:hypothetical protein
MALLYKGVALQASAPDAAREALERARSALPEGNSGLELLVLVPLAVMLRACGRPLDADREIRRWFALARSSSKELINAVQFGLQELAGSVDLDHLAAQLDDKSGASDVFVETAKMFRHVVAVVRAGELQQKGHNRVGPAARRRRAVALVPPELRQTVVELAESIAKQRMALKPKQGRSARTNR